MLIDEVEKAHPQLLTFFLSILDRGTTTDNRGNILNFSNCMLFFTSNLGYSDAQQRSTPIGYSDDEAKSRETDKDIRRDMRQALKPEFMNRVRMVHFNRLTRASIDRIFDLELDRIVRRYDELHDLKIVIEGPAREELIRRGFSPVFGARHLSSVLESTCNVAIARKIREDDKSTEGDRDSLVSWLREMRAGSRPFHAEQVRERVRELASTRLDYHTLRVLFDDDEFTYVPVQGAEGNEAEPS
jgi:ATP-dependent Clp protease ATP-binding subunit ClpB